MPPDDDYEAEQAQMKRVGPWITAGAILVVAAIGAAAWQWWWLAGAFAAGAITVGLVAYRIGNRR